MTDAIGRYLEQRENGHTKEYILASFKEPFKLIKTRDDYLRRLAKEYPDLPIDLLKKDKPSWPQPSFLDRLRAYLPLGNNAPWPLDPNDFERTKAYYLIDGDLAWHYDVVVEPNQPTFFLPETRDAKEYNPAYVVVLKKAGEYASKKMTEAGISAGLGSIHSFWGFKKDFLKQKGIDWKPPSELGNGYYD